MSASDEDRFDDLPILAELRGLLEARFAQAEATPRIQALARAGLRVAPMVLATAAAIAVAAAALIALSRGHSAPTAPAHTPVTPTVPTNPTAPNPPNPTPTEGGYIKQAQRDTVTRDPACVVHVNRGATFIHGSPGRALLSTLGVLRRSAPPADQTLRTLYGGGFDAGAGVYVDYVRRARTEFNKSFYIIPEARTIPFSPIPTRCYAEMHAALVRAVRHLAPQERNRILQLQAQQFATQRLQTEHRAGVCFAAVTTRRVKPPKGVDMGCGQSVPTLQNAMNGWLGEDHRGGGALLAGIVPDGVATVTLHYAAGGGDPARTLTSDVVNNVAVFEVPRHTFRQDLPASWIFRAADGRILKTITP
jgi:hypothetical protein